MTTIKFCKNCSLKCIASDCDCFCHTQNRAFNYGYKQGKEIREAKIRTGALKEVLNTCRKEERERTNIEVFNLLGEILNNLEDDLHMDKTGEDGYATHKEVVAAIKKHTLKDLRSKYHTYEKEFNELKKRLKK